MFSTNIYRTYEKLKSHLFFYLRLLYIIRTFCFGDFSIIHFLDHGVCGYIAWRDFIYQYLVNIHLSLETLRLNRLVEQTVLVGHYKRVGKSNDTEKFRKRTLVVLPMNNPHICETNVNVSTAVIDNMYEQVFLVRNVSNDNTEDTVDGSLYVDFRMKPGVKLISQEGKHTLKVLVFAHLYTCINNVILHI